MRRQNRITAKIRWLTGAGLALMAAGSTAAIKGKPVVLVHGFQPANLSSVPQNDAAVATNGYNYWTAYWGARAEARIDWSSTERIEGPTATRIFNKLKELSQQGLCNAGCVLVSHSTGDLVVRYILENQARWLQNAGLQPLKFLTALDFAGAGGGTELADLVVDVASNESWLLAPAKAAVRAFMGFDPKPANLGVIHDLRPNYARNLATSPKSVPRLRFVGGGSAYLGVTKPFVRGSDDGVVPVHSACGASVAGDFDSCVPGLKMDGLKSSVAAPGSLWYNHYPVLMSEGANHGDTIGTTTGNPVTYSANNFSAGGINVAFAQNVYTSSAWYQWWTDSYQRVKDGEKFSLSELTYQTLNK